MPYSELHVDSSDQCRTDGTRNNPKFQLTEELFVDHITLRHFASPLTFNNVLSNDKISLVTFIGTGDVATPTLPPAQLDGADYVVDFAEVPSDFYTPNSLSALLNGEFSNYTVVPDAEDSKGNVTISFTRTSPITGPKAATWIFFQNSSTIDPDRNGDNSLTSFMSFGFNGDYRQVIPVNDYEFTTGSIRAVLPQYLMLRSSNLMSGASHPAQVRGAQGSGKSFGAFNSQNIIAKIPLPHPNVSVGDLMQLSINDSPSRENSFQYNGQHIDRFDLYLTSPFSDIPLNLNGSVFSVTLGFFHA